MIVRSIKLDVRIDINQDDDVNVELYSAYCKLNPELKEALRLAIKRTAGSLIDFAKEYRS